MLQQHTQPANPPAEPFALSRFDLRETLRRAYAANRPLTLLGVLMLLTLVVSLIGLIADPRTITGAPAWLKPAKFSISIALYAFTLQWMLSLIEGRRFWVRAISGVLFVAFVVEMIIVCTQVLRGTTSHFNVGTPFDSTLFSLMGIFIMIMWVMTLIAAILLLIQRLPNPVMAWSIRLALLLTLIGAALGFLMTQPTPSQQAAMSGGGVVSVVGAHSVGVADGSGPMMPVTGWSMAGGDLRIGHFLGLHSLQLLPILGWLLTRRRATKRLSGGRRLALVWIGGVSYLALMALLTWQALRGQPLLAPDATTLAAAAAWLAATVVAASGVIGLGQRMQEEG